MKHLLKWVHITQGTASQPRFSCGNTLPLTQRPFGMAGFAPQTQGASGAWFYHPDSRCLEGIRLTHRPSPWIGDYGALLLAPQSGTPSASLDRCWSGYRPEEARLTPAGMHVRFLRPRCDVDLSPSDRGAAFRLRFDQTGKPLFLSLLRVANEIAFDWDGEALTGWTNAHTFPVKPGFKMYFVLTLDCPVNKEDLLLEEGAVHIPLSSPDVQGRLAISFVSVEQAKRNLQRELAGKPVEAVEAEAAACWEDLLGRIEIEAGEETLKTFYSCLYHTFLYPHKLYEYDEEGRPIHYDSCNDCVKPGLMYTDNGFWDTYRTVYPLYSLIAPEIYREILEGYLQIYRDSGWLPKWPSLTETSCMPGTLIDAVIADAAVKGILTGPALETALEGMCRHAGNTGEGIYGRQGVDEYLEYGYVPNDMRESVSQTLDSAYADFCIAQTAAILGREETARRYYARSQNYKNLFDPAVGFMRGRDRDGNWTPDFDEFNWGGDYTEGGPWQSSFAVPHDLEGLAGLYGGREGLLQKLDTLFATPPYYNVSGYGQEIHEMTEMAAVDFGQCAISNQPSFHYPWLYAALGEKGKAVYWIRRIVNELFSYRPDGFPGDEDNGTMAAWYIFACLGFYPLCPGKAEYVASEPLVSRIRLNGKPLIFPADKVWMKHEEMV